MRGKFFACLLPIIATIVVLFPPFALLLILQGISWAYNPGPWMVVVGIKFLISATFYIALVMVCSYYSKSGRTALVVSYVLLACYGLFNFVLWNLLLIPLFFDSSRYYNNYNNNYYNDYARSPWETSTHTFQLTPVEIVHMFQSALFAVVLLFFLGWKLRRHRAL